MTPHADTQAKAEAAPTMRAIEIAEFGGPEVLREVVRARPVAGAGEALILLEQRAAHGLGEQAALAARRADEARLGRCAKVRECSLHFGIDLRRDRRVDGEGSRGVANRGRSSTRAPLRGGVPSGENRGRQHRRKRQRFGAGRV